MNPSLTLKDIDFFYEHDYPLISHFSYTFDPGTATAIVGSSGSGKTTLLHIIAGLVSPERGAVSISNSWGDKNFSFIFSNPFLIGELDVFANIYLGLEQPTLIQSGLEDLMKIFDISSVLRHYPAMLSSGQQQRIAVLRAIVRKSAFVLADEPTAHLDKHRGLLLMQKTLELLREQKRGFICVTHDQTLLPLFDHVITLG
jgi:ABC-type lipoprotein export system ATPase subunit